MVFENYLLCQGLNELSTLALETAQFKPIIPSALTYGVQGVQ